ncbi:hypothetical protein [Crossiella sp. CA198]|uniref:hypothetical protein n=1 Tax=Crossiella sp. CA198 TaxID=3455607 RepID=UPI003F8D8DA6
MDDGVGPLRRLVLTGWTGSLIGNPANPEAIAYLRESGHAHDVVVVYGPEHAEAGRSVGGRVVRRAEGTPSDVVASVLSW